MKKKEKKKERERGRAPQKKPKTPQCPKEGTQNSQTPLCGPLPPFIGKQGEEGTTLHLMHVILPHFQRE